INDGVGDNLAGQQFGSVNQIGQTPGLHKRGHERPCLPWRQGVWPAVHFHRAKHHTTVLTAAALLIPIVSLGQRHLRFYPTPTAPAATPISALPFGSPSVADTAGARDQEAKNPALCAV